MKILYAILFAWLIGEMLVVGYFTVFVATQPDRAERWRDLRANWRENGWVENLTLLAVLIALPPVMAGLTLTWMYDGIRDRLRAGSAPWSRQ